ncbi:MmoB/DmpM family protein [Ponticaulis sp.]|uniref:MmoB/DmpM family protein n=1 Tax=Ponticaulis sp. TaxID=2020902 RepID=UPI000B667D44|nr:MmoB/DmpM family protein [Ponticaulis sp.]MAI91235.1 monooxygenase [Ponticaulis sp.]OUX98546.1 MAG: monooxygenase [Hyphomonadaceae bacterium TMED5]|tara:strand:- start:43138 stop:43407 length:270 start_codon:yes stop_codon:yes gene_type:complete
MSKVFIAFQANEDARQIIEAIEQDNPEAIVDHQPSMVKIDCEGRLDIRRETIEELMGRDFDLQELHLHLITLAGNVKEDEDVFSLVREA